MRRYKLTDLTIFACLLCLAEAVSAQAAAYFPGEVYAFSLSLFFTLLMMVRWGAFGIAYAPLGGAAFCLAHGGNLTQGAVYLLGNTFAAVNLLWFRFPGAERLRASAAYTSLYGVSGYLAMCLGRSVISAVLGQGFPAAAFLTADAVSAAVTVILLLISRKQDGFFEPQASYLARLKEEDGKHGT